jgi:hypothetical protein
MRNGNPTRYARATLGPLALGCALAAPLALAQAPAADPQEALRAQQVERRIESLRALVEGSSAARQIEASGNALAVYQRVEARQFVRLAEEAHAAHDERSATALLEAAARQMVESARLASNDAGRTAPRERDIAARIESAQALLAAQKRIAAEKTAPGAADTAREIERLLDRAKADLAAGRNAQAQDEAQQAYLLAKASVGSMRGGDTLVRQLKFANKEEEYHYEVDRYETHRMLVELLARKQAGEGAAPALARAADLRRQAAGSAERGEHAAAVAILEDATRELVRAIRAAGVFIPG